jgi:undecaprenyl-diphosphatase
MTLDTVLHLDIWIQNWAQAQQSPWLVCLMQKITFFGSPLAFTIIAILCLFIFLFLHKSKELMFLYVSLFSSWILMTYLKEVFVRSRPAGIHLTPASGYSFPSGHATVSIAFYGFLAYVLWYSIGSNGSCGNRWRRFGSCLLGCFALIIGFSRVYLNVHYTSDVLGGFLLGGICLFLSIKGLRASIK